MPYKPTVGSGGGIWGAEGYRYSPEASAVFGALGGNQSKNKVTSPSNGGYGGSMPSFGGYGRTGGGAMGPGGKIQPMAPGVRPPQPLGMQTPPIYAGGNADPTRKGYPQVTQGQGAQAPMGSSWTGVNSPYQQNPFSSNKMFGGQMKGQMQRRGVGNVPGTPHPYQPNIGHAEAGNAGNVGDINWAQKNRDLVNMGFWTEDMYKRWLAGQGNSGADTTGGGGGNAA